MKWIKIVPTMWIVTLISFMSLVMLKDEIILVSWNICLCDTTTWVMNLKMDWLSLSFFSIIMYVSTTVLMYSDKYMGADLLKFSFIILLMGFIVSMIVLSFSSNLLMSMVGWDGLGITSFLLILYYQSWNSLCSGLVTFMTSRLGDCLLISVLIISLFEFEVTLVMGMMFMLASFTKSGQFPFSTWLPLAMAAPTPVSSLVHSSTLVTAGIYMLIRFSYLLSDTILCIGLILSSLTSFYSSVSALVEWDLKKVIALSTLSHIGMMMVFVFIQQLGSAMIHLLAHAVFKSALFMLAGELIHKSKDSQDIRHMSVSNQLGYVWFGMMVCMASMSGIPFLAGFYSKEIMLSISSSTSCWWVVLFLCLASMTVAYSVRLIVLFMRVPVGMSSYVKLELESVAMPYFLMISSSIIGSITIEWIMFSYELESNTWSNVQAKSILIVFMSLGLMLGWMMSRMQIKGFISDLWFLPSLGKGLTLCFRSTSFYSFNYLDQKGQLDKIWVSLKLILGMGWKKYSLMGYEWVLYEIWIVTIFMLSVFIIWMYLWPSS